MSPTRTFALWILVSVSSATAFAADTKTTPSYQAAEKLLNMMSMDKLTQQSTTNMVDAMLGRLPPKAQNREALQAFFKKYVGWAALKDDFIQIYVEAFSEKELQDLIAFYKTPTGQKAITVVPSLMQKGAQIGQSRVQKHLPELLKTLGLKK
ncbi:MAG: DUF2059 domain-containing protein [Deltaproteobacteria bacterium]|nr:DUF2059 domain-containing protein [Deltaproteobacteria bacterium]MBT6433021.1 DUF2059 domain-containing protein [Deltaproteobacteria bacterium]MBT6490732.1 DUF2059 domain-containing protein [Deltaproteobacteria bacterium]